MSESTIGTLFLTTERARVEAKLRELELECKSGDLNAKWSAAFLADEFLIDKKTVEGLKEVSKTAPVLYFQSAEDYGWTYMLFDQGENVASVYVSYDRAFYTAQQWLEERYPDVDVFGGVERDVWAATEAEVMASQAYKDAEMKQYAHANPNAFGCFDLSQEQLTALAEVVSLGYKQTHERWDQVNAFKKILGIEEMSWQSYHFVRV